jgi:hypothetical protein
LRDHDYAPAELERIAQEMMNEFIAGARKHLPRLNKVLRVYTSALAEDLRRLYHYSDRIARVVIESKSENAGA